MKDRDQRETRKIGFVKCFISFHVNEFLTYTYQLYLIFIQNSVLKQMLKFIMARETISKWKVSLRKKTRTVYATQRSFSNRHVLLNKILI